MFKSMSTRFAAWNERRETVRELSMLSDRELADLGIGRGDIHAVADGSLVLERATAPLVGRDAPVGWTEAAPAPTSLAA